ncbi:hypothetical protein JTB14_038123 [Gonioctena quinquepunctata]|nr:hypothetical protein JTB14_038123 [Gonioctena quinquepunctata]
MCSSDDSDNEEEIQVRQRIGQMIDDVSEHLNEGDNEKEIEDDGEEHGSTTEIEPSYSKYGQGAAVVLQLSKELEPNKHKLYCDNYFTSYYLLQILNQKSIFLAGTTRLNRFSKPPLTDVKDFFLKERGSTEQIISTDGIVVTRWLQYLQPQNQSVERNQPVEKKQQRKEPARDKSQHGIRIQPVKRIQPVERIQPVKRTPSPLGFFRSKFQ